MNTSNSEKTLTEAQKVNVTKTLQDDVDEVIIISYLGSEKDNSVSVYPVFAGYLE